MKRIFFTVMFALIASAGTILADKVKVEDLYYNLDTINLTAEVTYKERKSQYGSYVYNKDWTLATANIPDSIEYNSKTYSVTSIGSHAFRNCRSLTTVTIGNRITNIGDHAFYGCHITTVTIPNGVTVIGELLLFDEREHWEQRDNNWA